ncbi:alpha/beta hydrolase [Pseudomonas fontis]|uniref:Alpha/beta hydrolase n=1 Tax=Pseudomonas fontis TaxID=2942633 RepID=A0ABT5NKD8_9PSED|nr:alpha/beta hydrolase [Pseudomonas fontis]MDD0977469.1 alpha/beta hydrolase [Pseudomonas fontis]MDD0988997.1 alpha/beta hydrolase [Pseudomonas fontis]
MTLHPDIGAFIDLAEESQLRKQPFFHEMAPEQAREAFEQTTRQLQWSAPANLHVEALAAPARDGARIPLRLYRPQQRAAGLSGLIVYFHGGGYVVGSLDSHDGVCREFCQRSGYPVLSVGYRLAPQHKFPMALHDCSDSLAWLKAQGAALGFDLERVALVGDSVGASLATVLSIEAAQAGDQALITPKVQLLCYPMTDASQRSASMELFAEGYFLESDTLEWFYTHYARTTEDRLDWRFSPLLADEVKGAAPAVVVVAGFDPLLDEGLAYARKLREEGVAVELIEYADLTHDLLRLRTVVPEIEQVHQALAEVVQRYLG